MISEKGGSAEILERLMSSYGVHTQKDLAAALDIAANNISGWTRRDSVPGNAIIKCVLDTGVDLHWLLNGELANANRASLGHIAGGDLYKQIISNGGKQVLRRILDAYGFTMQKQLCELLGISSATVSTWVRRNHFPGEVVVTCALDTGISLQWLATGKGLKQNENIRLSVSSSIPRKNLNDGILLDAGYCEIDLSFISYEISKPFFFSSNTGAWIADKSVAGISNGRWLLGIDDKYDVYDVNLLPGNKINVVSKGANFVCGVEEVRVAGKIVLTMNYGF